MKMKTAVEITLLECFLKNNLNTSATTRELDIGIRTVQRMLKKMDIHVGKGIRRDVRQSILLPKAEAALAERKKV